MIWLLLLLALQEGTLQEGTFAKSPLAKPYIGVCTSVGNDSLLAAHGVMYIEETVANSFNPRNVSEEKFAQVLTRLKNAKVKVRTANVFIPGSLKLVGPAVNEEAVLGYVDTVMQRAQKAGVEIIVLGSGEARKIPRGYDSVAASKQFIELVRKMSAIAGKYQRVIAIENLNHTETNFVLSLAEALRIVKAVNHPSFRLTADIYHMLMENEGPDAILEAKELLVNVHIAEKEERAYPGKRKTDFTPYFRAMQKVGYMGGIMMECRWGNLAAELPLAAAYLTEQLAR